MRWENEWRQQLRDFVNNLKDFKRRKFLSNKLAMTDVYPFLASIDTEDIVNLLILVS